MLGTHTPHQQKVLGAYYTPADAAKVLVDWAVRTPQDRVLDPACGGGVFLEAAVARLGSLRGRAQQQISGIEIDGAVYKEFLVRLLNKLNIPGENVIFSSFFDVSAEDLPRFDAVVGNPPFIRYQTFKGPNRDKALTLARSIGVEISELTSSWAPFLLHATEFIAPGGRLAMVVPAEFTHAAYARPVVRYLALKFERLYLARLTGRLFPDLNQDACLLFADCYGGQSTGFELRRFSGLDELLGALRMPSPFGQRVRVEDLCNGSGRLRDHFLPPEVAGLYNFLAGDERVCRLGKIAEVGIGYVTGNNAFFHFSEEDVRLWRLPRRYLKPVLTRSGPIKGLVFTHQDWAELVKGGEKMYLLALPRTDWAMLPKAVGDYLRQGERDNIHLAYKCRVRKPWYHVPHSGAAEAFLTYMSGEAPRLVWNSAHVLATNSLHEVRIKRAGAEIIHKLAIIFFSSLSQLSAEVEGHPLGGGMLKLEPSEAQRVLMVRPELLRLVDPRFPLLDSLVRCGKFDAAADFADEIVLRDSLGLTWDQIQVLRDGRKEVKESRRKRLDTARSH